MVLGLYLLTGVEVNIGCRAEILSWFGKVFPLRRLGTETTVYGFDETSLPSHPELTGLLTEYSDIFPSKRE